MEIVITRAGIVSSLFLSYDFEQTDLNAKHNNKTTSDAPIHDDLRQAFRALIPHFVFMCEEINDEKIIADAIENPEDYLKDEESSKYPAFLKYYVSEFTLQGKGDATKLKIFGSKRLEDFKSISWTAPEIFLDNSKYKFHSELLDAVDVLKAEVIAYMEGKQAPNAQLEMFGGGEEEEE